MWLVLYKYFFYCFRCWAGSWWRARSRVEVCPITCRLNSPLSELPFQVFHNIYPTNHSKQYLSNFSTVFVRHNIPTIFARQLGPFANSTKILVTIIGSMKLAQFCNLLLLCFYKNLVIHGDMGHIWTEFQLMRDGICCSRQKNEGPI